jgi:hypothetical protein
MPWVPGDHERRIAIAVATAEAGQSRIPFFEGIANEDPEVLADSFSADPLVDDPRHGTIAGGEAFARYMRTMRDWLARETAGVDHVELTRTADRFVEEVSIRLRGDHPELPVAIVSDVGPDGGLIAVRIYHSLWPLTGDHEVRAPLLDPDPTIRLEGAPAQYQRGLAAGNAETVIDAFEPDGIVREPSGGPYTYSGQEHHKIYDLMFANGGGIPLKFCTLTDDGTACAIEYVCDQWGKDAIPPQAGVAVYVRGKRGKLAAARIYDDVTPPESSDSSVQTH